MLTWFSQPPEEQERRSTEVKISLLFFSRVEGTHEGWHSLGEPMEVGVESSEQQLPASIRHSTLDEAAASCPSQGHRVVALCCL